MAQPAVQPVAQPALAIPVDLLDPCPFQTRTFPKDDPALAELAASIGKLGVLQDLIARPHPEDDGRFELASGERRWRAAQFAKLDAVPVKVLDLDDAALAEVCAVENLQREQLHPLEEADAIRLLVDRAGWDHAAVADQLGKSLAFVGRRARLANLSPAWREAVADPEHPASRWSASHLLLIARLEVDQQEPLLSQPHEHWWWTASVATLRHRLDNLTRQLARAPFSTKSTTLCSDAGACVACPKRSSYHPGLFDDADDRPLDSGDERIPAGDRCLDAACWKAKFEAYIAQREGRLRERFGDDLVLLSTMEHGRGRRSYHFDKAKKSADDAEPVLYLDGPKAGEFAWAVNRYKKRPAPSSNSAQRVREQRRRTLSRVLQYHVGNLPAPKPPVLFALALGLNSLYAFNTEPGLGLAEQWEAVETFLELPRAELHERFWTEKLRPRLASRLDDLLNYRDLDEAIPMTTDDDGPTVTLRELLAAEIDHIFDGSVDLAQLVEDAETAHPFENDDDSKQTTLAA